MVDNKKAIKEIIKIELKALLEKISIDFKGNVENKINNWTLAEFDDTLIAHMVFVSSFESKSGNMLQKIAKKIAELRYGEENVPEIVCESSVTKEELAKFKITKENDSQVILTHVDQSDCQKFIASFKEKHKASGKGKGRIEPTLTQEMLKEINKEKFSVTREITSKPVDLLFYNPEESKYYLMEIKAGGDLDSSNAPGNVIKMLTEYAILRKSNVKLYFATLYNKNGEGNSWTGIIKKYFGSDMLLIGKNFWEVILPKEVSFKELTDIYEACSKELEVNGTINKLISSIKD